MQRVVRLRDGTAMPVIGQGTWHMGDDDAHVTREVAALRAGIAAGATLIDTAEMYGDGRAETLVARALRDVPRASLFLVSKVLPRNASRARLARSCARSRRRLSVDYLDLYLLHWRSRDAAPLAETVAALNELVACGAVRYWGVSNFDVDDMAELWAVPGGTHCVVNEVLYHVASRGVEYALLPWLQQHGVAVLAYCPLAQAGRLHRPLLAALRSDDTTTTTTTTATSDDDAAAAGARVLQAIAARHGVRVTHVMLAFVIRDGNVVAIPQSSNEAHARDNAAAAQLTLTSRDMAELDAAFPPPRHKMPLDIV